MVFTYIDGFNLYHSIVELGKQNEYLKWQNLKKLAECFLNKDEKIAQIKFFSAYPKWKEKLESYARHKVFVEIQKDLGAEIILGNFKRKEFTCPNCHKTITKHEEKQTDVNIALEIINDIYTKKPSAIQLISGDTDLIPPLKLARSLGVKVYVVAPPNRAKSAELRNISNHLFKIRHSHLRRCFLGETYKLKNGEILSCPYALPPAGVKTKPRDFTAYNDGGG